jgi:hypothetical protein
MRGRHLDVTSRKGRPIAASLYLPRRGAERAALLHGRRMTSGRRRVRPLAAAGSLLLATGCDPILNLYGSFFPAWIVCLLTGVVLAVVLRFVFAATGLEEGFAPLLLVYPALAFLIACLTWLVLFRD